MILSRWFCQCVRPRFLPGAGRWRRDQAGASQYILAGPRAVALGGVANDPLDVLPGEAVAGAGHLLGQAIAVEVHLWILAKEHTEQAPPLPEFEIGQGNFAKKLQDDVWVSCLRISGARKQ